MRWKPLCGMMTLLLAVTGGCSKPVFMTESDYNRVMTTSLEGMELRPDLGHVPLTEIVPAPPSLNNLDRQVRFISLSECVAIALENGRVGQANLIFPGTANDNLVQFTGQGVTGSDAIRVFALDPALTGSNIEAALSKFDAQFVASMNWTTTDQPIGTPLQTFQAGASGVNSINQQEATGSVALLKPMATGGVTGITFNMPYQYTNLPARVNPSYRPQLQFQFEQPLLQGYGVEINQIRTAHPGSLILGLPVDAQRARTAEGILISRLRFDQQRAEFERQLNQMLLNVEVGYWNLYGSYWTLYSREQGLRFAFEAFKLNKAKYEAGRATAADFYQSRGQYELFRAQRLQALDEVLERERQLRSLMGIPVEDGTRLMPADAPTLAPYQPDWTAALAEALQKRPELYMVRQQIKTNQMNIILQKNFLLPDLRFAATYDVNSIGNRLDGGATPFVTRDEFTNQITGTRDANALRGLSDGNFNSWSVGLRLFVPLGYRETYANMRRAQLDLARTMEVLKDQELKVQSYLWNYYRRISTAYERIRANRAQRESFGEQLRARNQEFLAGRGTLDILLEAQRFWADALSNEYQAIVDYNNALAGFEFAKGTIQQHDNVHVAEGPIPQCAAVRAVDRQRQRTAALVLMDRAAPVPVTPEAPAVPTIDGRAPSLPSVMSAVPPLRDAPALPGVTSGASLPGPVEVRPEQMFSDVPGAEKLPAPKAPPTPVPSTPPTTPPVSPGTTASGGGTRLAPPTARKPVARRGETEFGSIRAE